MYVFASNCLSNAQTQYVSGFLRKWTTARGLLEGRDKFVSLIATYLKHCCPADIDDRGLRLLGEYLVLYYELYVTFHDPRVSTDSYSAMVLTLMTALRGAEVSASTPFSEAAKCLGADIEDYTRRGLSKEPFLRRLGEMFDAFVWNRGIPSGSVVHPGLFWQKRVHLVSQLPYVELCNLVVGNHTEGIVSESDLVDTLASEITFLANEVGSMTRDFSTDGRQNLLKSFIVHRGWSLADTLAHFVEWHNRKQPEMRRIADEQAARSMDSASLTRHTEIQEVVTHGCFHSMLELRSRYGFSDAELAGAAECCKALYFTGAGASS